MANFTVRVELHKGEWIDYERLHTAMAWKGFSRLITADSGTAYHLPWAEYTRSGSFSSMQVLDIARCSRGRNRQKPCGAGSGVSKPGKGEINTGLELDLL